MKFCEKLVFESTYSYLESTPFEENYEQKLLPQNESTHNYLESTNNTNESTPPEIFSGKNSPASFESTPGSNESIIHNTSGPTPKCYGSTPIETNYFSTFSEFLESTPNSYLKNPITTNRIVHRLIVLHEQ